MKIYPQALTFTLKPQIWAFDVVDLQTTAKKQTKMKRCTCRACKAIVFPLNIQFFDVLVAVAVAVTRER